MRTSLKTSFKSYSLPFFLPHSKVCCVITALTTPTPLHVTMSRVYKKKKKSRESRTVCHRRGLRSGFQVYSAMPHKHELACVCACVVWFILLLKLACKTASLPLRFPSPVANARARGWNGLNRRVSCGAGRKNFLLFVLWHTIKTDNGITISSSWCHGRRLKSPAVMYCVWLKTSWKRTVDSHPRNDFRFIQPRDTF